MTNMETKKKLEAENNELRSLALQIGEDLFGISANASNPNTRLALMKLANMIKQALSKLS